MCPPWKKKKTERERRAPREQIELLATDDTMTRARKMIRLMGFGGETALFAMRLYDVLKIYEQLDETAHKGTPS